MVFKFNRKFLSIILAALFLFSSLPVATIGAYDGDAVATADVSTPTDLVLSTNDTALEAPDNVIELKVNTGLEEQPQPNSAKVTAAFFNGEVPVTGETVVAVWSDPDVACVTTQVNGNEITVTAVAAGTAKIKATYSYEYIDELGTHPVKLEKEFIIKVTDEYKAVESFEIIPEKDTYDLYKDTTGNVPVEFVVKPADASYTSIESTVTGPGTLVDGKILISDTAVKGDVITITGTVKFKNLELKATATITIEDTTPVAVTAVEVSGADSINLQVSDKTTLTAEVVPADADMWDGTFTWSSSDTAIATVDANGVVTLLAEGEVTITASADGSGIDGAEDIKGSHKITIYDSTPIPVQSVTVTEVDGKTTLDVYSDANAQLTAAVTPDDADAWSKTFSWTSSDESIAIVDSKGKVTAVGEGEVTITATAVGSGADGAADLSAGYTFTITDSTPIPVESVTVTPQKVTLDLNGNKTVTLVASVNPENASDWDETFSWASSNDVLVEVDENGVVTAKGITTESVVITVAANGTNKTAVAIINVVDTTAVIDEFTLTADPVRIDLAGTDLTSTITAQVTMTNEGTFDGTVELAITEGADKATLAGNVLTGNALGKVTITGTIVGTDKTASVDVMIIDTTAPVEIIAVSVAPTVVSLDLYDKKTETLVPTVTMSDGSVYEGTVEFVSNDTAIVTVDANGVLTAAAVGQTTVTVKAGDMTATAIVKVADTTPVISGLTISADPTKIDLAGTDLTSTITTQVTMTNSGTFDGTVDLAITEGADKATLSGNILTGTAIGKVTVTATIAGTDFTKSVDIMIIDTTAPPAPIAVTPDPKEINLDLNGTKTGEITAEVTMSDGSKYTGTVEFTVADDKIATVDADGNVTAVAVGETTITVKAGDATATVKVTVADTTPKDKKEAIRLYGNSRVETAVAISVEGRASADVVFLSTAKNFADALAGGPLAHAMNGPILLTNNAETLEADVLATITKLGAKEVVYLGGENAVRNYDSVLLAISSVEKTSRVSGQSRYTTAIAIADKLAAVTGKQATQVFLASGTNFPDALAISPVAAITGSPIVFTYGNEHKTLGKTLDSDTAAYLTKTNPATRVTVGGTAAVSAESHTQAGATDRVYGTSRFLTAVEIYNKYASVFTAETKGVALATGMSFPDALVGGVIAAREGMPLLLVLNTNPTSDASYATVCSTIAKINADKIYLFGGSAAIADATLNAYVANISTFDTTRAYMG